MDETNLPLSLRRATWSDEETLFRWRNDAATRANSRHTAPVSRRNHGIWFRKCMGDPNIAIWIAEWGGEPVGVVRAHAGPTDTELHWTVAPEYRDNGFGSRAVELVIEGLPPGGVASAAIKPFNEASRKVARKAGMERRGTRGDLLRYTAPTGPRLVDRIGETMRQQETVRQQDKSLDRTLDSLTQIGNGITSPHDFT